MAMKGRTGTSTQITGPRKPARPIWQDKTRPLPDLTPEWTAAQQAEYERRTKPASNDARPG